MSLKSQVRTLSRSLDKVRPPSSPAERYNAWRIARQREWVEFECGMAPVEAWPDLMPPYPLDEAEQSKYLRLLGVEIATPSGEPCLRGHGMRIWAIREAQRLRIADRADVQALWPSPDLSETDTPAVGDGEDSPLLDAIVVVLKASSRAAGCGWNGPGTE